MAAAHNLGAKSRNGCKPSSGGVWHIEEVGGGQWMTFILSGSLSDRVVIKLGTLLAM